jgi:uncharacterized protein YkwD
VCDSCSLLGKRSGSSHVGRWLFAILCGSMACLMLPGCQDVVGEMQWEVVTATPATVVLPAATAEPTDATLQPATVARPAAAAETSVLAVQPADDDLEQESIDGEVLELAALINLARIDAGVAELAWSLELEEAAMLHAQDMGDHDFVSHTGSDGSDLVTRMERAGYDPAWRGEIIAQVMGGPEEALAWWWDSQLHRETMLGEAYRDFGVGRAPHLTRAGWNNFVVVFGRQ